MKLTTKLLVGTLLQVALVVVISGFLVTTSLQINGASDKLRRAEKIVEVVSQLRFVTFENLLHHDQRSYEQWQIKHDNLAPLLQHIASQTQAERGLLDDISRLSVEIEPIFSRLVDSYSEAGAYQAELQERLATQLLVKQQTQISNALQLSSLADQESATLTQRANVLTAVVIGVMLLISVVNFGLITRTVTSALRALQKGAEAIAAGKFDYRIKPKQPSDEFGRVSIAFNSMAESVGEIDKAKSEFILLASHQLRTPLTAVKWYSKELETANEKLPPEQRQKYTTQIYKSNERMIDLVNKLLDAAKIGFGRLAARPEHLQVVDVLEQALHDVMVEMVGRKIEVTTDVSSKQMMVTIDPTWLRIILQNLLSNAIRYSRAGQKVVVKLRPEAGNVLITVADKGYGIPAAQQAKIFTKLFRADNANKIVEDGSGLGLYITKAMAEQAGGKIWFTSAENKGSTFYVSLPADKNEPTIT
jgi:signal transduction histidine kinase